MRILILLCLLLTLTTGVARAKFKQPRSGVAGGARRALPVGLATRAPSIEASIDDIQSTYRSLADLTAEFTQDLFVKTIGRSINNQGTLWLKRPDKMRIEYRGATPQQYISDGKSLWVYKPGDTQAAVYTIGKNAAIPREALAFLNGFGELRTLFTIKTAKFKKDGMYLELAPKQSGGYTQLDCQFDRVHLLSTLTIHNTTGGTATYRFGALVTNGDVAESLFHFQAPQGVNVVHQ